MAASDLSTTLQTLIDCVCSALADADRPVCACGMTVGPPVIGPAQCCECDGDTGGQVTGNLERVFPVTGVLLESDTRVENCRPGLVAADFTIVVTRCYPTLDEQGNMPDLDQTTDATIGLHTDVGLVWNALKCCGTNLVFRESAVTADPDGGCSAFAVRVTVPVSMGAS